MLSYLRHEAVVQVEGCLIIYSVLCLHNWGLQAKILFEKTHLMHSFISLFNLRFVPDFEVYELLDNLVMGPGQGLCDGFGLLTNEGASLVKEKGFHVLYFSIEGNLNLMHLLIKHTPQLLVIQNDLVARRHLTAASLTESIAKSRRHSGVHPTGARYIPIEFTLPTYHALPATRMLAHSTTCLHHRSFLTS